MGARFKFKEREVRMGEARRGNDVGNGLATEAVMRGDRQAGR